MVRKVIIAIIVFFLFIILKNQIIIQISIIKACELFFHKIFPSLFPIFIISSFLVDLNISNYINPFFYKLNYFLFKINKPLSSIIILSLIAGCPGGAKITKDMYNNKVITKDDIQKIILFTHFCNPLFIIGIVKYKTLLVLFAHYVSNFIIGIFIRNKKCSNNTCINNKDKDIVKIFTDSINSTMSTLLFILGTIVFFNIITSIINIPIFNIVLELSQGMDYISNINISLKLKTILFGSLLSFGGICIHFQVYGLLSDINIKYYPYLLARLSQSFITAILIIILY